MADRALTFDSEVIGKGICGVCSWGDRIDFIVAIGVFRMMAISAALISAQVLNAMSGTC